jgi:hypothetical protein
MKRACDVLDDLSTQSPIRCTATWFAIVTNECRQLCPPIVSQAIQKSTVATLWSTELRTAFRRSPNFLSELVRLTDAARKDKPDSAKALHDLLKHMASTIFP